MSNSNKTRFEVMKKEVFYNKEPLTLLLFYGIPCLWMHSPQQRDIPKMEFVGGFPNERCIEGYDFLLKDLYNNSTCGYKRAFF